MSLSLSTSSSSLPQAFDLNITNASLNSYPSSSPSTTLQANLSAAMMLIPLVLGGTLLSADVGFSQSIPEQAQVIDQKALNVLETVEPPSVVNLTNVFLPPGLSVQNATAKPFHVYNDGFYDILGPDPTLTVIGSTGGDPIFHEAVVCVPPSRYPPTDEMFFVQNAGAEAAGTGLNKSNSIYKISLAQAAAVSNQFNASGSVNITHVNATPPVINSNGATNYRGQILFTGEGQGDDTPPSLFIMNPVEPYNTTVLLNNFFGRQFNSLNDVAINPRNGDVYFTDTLYGYLQDFRPPPALPNMVYRLTPSTGALVAVADGFELPNGVIFSPNGSYAYVTDTGAQGAFYGYNFSAPASIYRFTVEEDGTWSNRKLFSYVSPGIPDGIHCDTNGNVYSGVGDGVHVWNPSGVLLGKIFVGSTSANFNFAGKGRMVIAAETQLYYVTLAAEGAVVASEMPQ
ncbi:hypothetical protein B0A52_06732 [Exophiala mesophila]|uniref:SMP-30/Gluconolactonase/LRE-like region domain-containing protein n=1 Tax=Exophiala mesophila TaxID=212818 RepID=A0A438N1R0_EXOME|nr:hypothetical protein B0A52_06732 [Exophiala mesophila]